MTLADAVKILNERKHRGWDEWTAGDGRAIPSDHCMSYDDLSEFEAIAIAEKYVRGDTAAEHLAIEVEVPGDATDDEAIAVAVEAARLADDLHRSLGGRGLKVADDPTPVVPARFAAPAIRDAMTEAVQPREVRAIGVVDFGGPGRLPAAILCRDDAAFIHVEWVQPPWPNLIAERDIKMGTIVEANLVNGTVAPALRLFSSALIDTSRLAAAGRHIPKGENAAATAFVQRGSVNRPPPHTVS